MHTSWNKVSQWYNDLVGSKGHYYHQNVILPLSLKLLELKPTSTVLDLACGQGILARQLPKTVSYLGLDLSPELIKFAQKQNKNPNHKYQVSDVSKVLNIKDNFSHTTCILALQNIKDPQAVIHNASKALQSKGKLLLVLNHPMFRIPRQSSWETDSKNKLQYRRINRYLSPLEIPITAHPGQKNSPLTWTYHLPLSSYSAYLNEAGFVIEKIEEWTSDKVSLGKAAKSENRSRSEFPLFMAILAHKN